MATLDARAMAAPRPEQLSLRRLRRFFRTPKGLMLVVLLLLLALALPATGVTLALPGLLGAVVVGMLLDGLLLRLTKGAWEFPSGALLSALFVVTVLDAHEPWYVPICTTVLAINSKYLLRTRWANIFNPAAIALVASYFLFSSGQSWWGALPELPWPLIAVLLAAVVFIAQRINKLPMVVAFAGGYFLIFTLVSFIGDPAGVAELFRVPNINAVLFFAGFMLTDPPTSPTRHGDQVRYALIVAATSAAIYLLLGGVYFLPAGLLVGNAWEAWRRMSAHRQRARRSGQQQPTA